MRIQVGRSGPDHYAVLALTPGASSTDITRAYRTLMRQLHPDAQVGQDLSGSTAELTLDGITPSAPATSQDALRRVMDAYLVLGDPARRAAYDQHRAASPAHTSPDAAIRENHSRAGAPPPIKAGPVKWHQ